MPLWTNHPQTIVTWGSASDETPKTEGDGASIQGEILSASGDTSHERVWKTGRTLETFLPQIVQRQGCKRRVCSARPSRTIYVIGSSMKT